MIGWRTKRIVVAVVLVGVGMVVSVHFLAYRHARAMLWFADGGEVTGRPETLSLGEKVGVLVRGVRLPRPDGKGTPLDFGLEYESGLIACDNGIDLGYWHVPSSEENAVALMFHGYRGDKSTLLEEAKAWHDLGYATVLVDFRGSGSSSESYTSVGYVEGEDVAHALRFVQETMPYRRHVLFGQSMGGAAVLKAVHGHGVEPDGIVVESVFDDIVETVGNRFEAMGLPSFPAAQLMLFWGGRQLGFDPFSHKPMIYAEAVRCPILFMHGSEDARARVDEGRRVFEAVAGEKRFVEFDGLGHEKMVTKVRDRWGEEVEWLMGRARGS
ncbi:MAG: alpha/beta fold hydrolase [Verrucomicrobiota bacterium]